MVRTRLRVLCLSFVLLSGSCGTNVNLVSNSSWSGCVDVGYMEIHFFESSYHVFLPFMDASIGRRYAQRNDSLFVFESEFDSVGSFLHRASITETTMTLSKDTVKYVLTRIANKDFVTENQVYDRDRVRSYLKEYHVRYEQSQCFRTRKEVFPQQELIIDESDTVFQDYLSPPDSL